jgi:hypothetical protein
VSDLADRVSRVRLLLETLNDPYPTPRSALRGDSGPAVSRYVPCETCRRSGWVKKRRGLLVLCLACDGRGSRRRQRGDGEWDAYVGLPVTEAVALPVEIIPRPAILDDEERGYAWERLKASYERRGSYREVRFRHSQLAGNAPLRHHLIQVVLIDQEPYELEPRHKTEIDLGVTMIALRMRSVRVPPWLLQHEQETVNATIRGLANQGLKPGQIAGRLGLSPEAVKRSLRRQKQRENRLLEAV